MDESNKCKDITEQEQNVFVLSCIFSLIITFINENIDDRTNMIRSNEYHLDVLRATSNAHVEMN